MKLLETFESDLIVLDVMLANENGIDWCMNARSYTNAPIVFLSSREEDEVKISALSYGGDDYVTKPFSPGVLMSTVLYGTKRESCRPCRCVDSVYLGNGEFGGYENGRCTHQQFS